MGRSFLPRANFNVARSSLGRDCCNPPRCASRVSRHHAAKASYGVRESESVAFRQRENLAKLQVRILAHSTPAPDQVEKSPADRRIVFGRFLLSLVRCRVRWSWVASKPKGLFSFVRHVMLHARQLLKKHDCSSCIITMHKDQ